MHKNYDYDYIIIGSGPAGRTAALELAKVGKHVALIDCQPLGGAELNTRDLPYKANLEFAFNYHKLNTSPAVSKNSCHFNLPTLTSATENLIASVREKYFKELQASGVQFINGFAHFLDSHTIAIDESRYTAKYFILATGSELKATEISGLETVNFLTPDDAMSVRRLPRFVFVVGGGPTGVQLAEYFAMLGSGVIIMERGTHLLPREDEEVSAALTNYLTEELGVTVVANSKVVTITEDHSSKIVVFTSGAGEKMVRVDAIALATGSEPFLDYGLENAGVDYKRSGIITDKYFNTTAKNIFAIGDCIGDADSSTERAIKQAKVLVENLTHRQKTTAKYTHIARVVNTYPAVAVLGLNERDVLSRDLKSKRSVTYLNDLPDFHHLDTPGFVKTLTDHSGRFLGASIVAPDANLAIQLKNLLPK